MKRLLLVVCFALALGTLGPVSAATTGTIWPFHRHHKDPAAAKASKPAKSKSEKSKKSFFHHGKSDDKAREQSARAPSRKIRRQGPRTVRPRRSRRRRFSRPQVRGLAPPDPRPSRRRRLLAPPFSGQAT